LILVVDDNESLRYIHHAFLKSWGYRVAEAESGEEAVRQARRACPSVILLDLSMPGMGGLEVARILKAGLKTRDIPILGISCFDRSEVEDEAHRSGLFSLLQKPVEPGDLQAAIRLALKGSAHLSLPGGGTR